MYHLNSKLPPPPLPLEEQGALARENNVLDSNQDRDIKLYKKEGNREIGWKSI
jgi:hypothetical protein